MNAAQNILSVADVTLYQSDVMFPGDITDISVSLEFSVFGRKLDRRFPTDMLFMQAAVVLQILDCNTWDLILLCNLL